MATDQTRIGGRATKPREGAKGATKGDPQVRVQSTFYEDRELGPVTQFLRSVNGRDTMGFAGQRDGGDPSRFSIRFVSDGKERVLVGRLLDDQTVEFSTWRNAQESGH